MKQNVFLRLARDLRIRYTDRVGLELPQRANNMSKSSTFWLPALALVTAVLLSGGAAAQATYNLTTTANGGTCGNPSSINYGNFASCNANNVTVSAWSMDRGAGTVDSLTGSGYANAQLSNQGTSGWGAKNRREGTGAASPEHSVDGIVPGLADMILLSFASATVLDDIRMGWVAGDSDIAVLRWAGASAPGRTDGAGTDGSGSTAVANRVGANLTDTVAGVNTAGWQLVGAYPNVGTTQRDLNIDSLASSWWLIAAFNTTMASGGSNNCRGFNGSNPSLANATNNTNCDGNNDGFKLQYISTKAGNAPRDGTGPRNQVPEPGSLALIGVALFGLAGTRRGWFKKS